MPTTTYTPLANITLGSSAASVTFSSISQAYRDLVIVCSVRSNMAAAFDQLYFRYNGDTSSNNHAIVMRGNGSATWSYAQPNSNTGVAYEVPGASATAGQFGNSVIQVMDYSATDKHKTSLVRTDYAANATYTVANRWAATSAVTSIVLYTDSTFVAGSTFALYGIAA